MALEMDPLVLGWSSQGWCCIEQKWSLPTKPNCRFVSKRSDYYPIKPLGFMLVCYTGIESGLFLTIIPESYWGPALRRQEKISSEDTSLLNLHLYESGLLPDAKGFLKQDFKGACKVIVSQRINLESWLPPDHWELVKIALLRRVSVCSSKPEPASQTLAHAFLQDKHILCEQGRRSLSSVGRWPVEHRSEQGEAVICVIPESKGL